MIKTSLSFMMIEAGILNDPQKIAVQTTQGPFRIIAGPGAGKTRVLTHRIAHLLSAEQVAPYHIIALTFTNRAGREMKERLQALVGDQARGLWIGTFHSLFARILRYEAQIVNYSPNFTIYDRDDSRALIKKLVKEAKLSEEQYRPQLVLNRISAAKNHCLDATAYLNDPTCQQEDRRMHKPRMSELFQQYEARCKQADAMDFDDLLLTTYHLFRDHPTSLAKYQERFQYVLVDEFQDTNILQYILLKKLVALHSNLCVIGDDAQSIYAFRGASVANMLNFKQDFPQAQEVKLEQNYRSTQHIVAVANSLIKHNQEQLDKTLFTQNPLGERIQVKVCKSDLEEVKQLASDIFEMSQQNRITYDQVAVLYRTNNQSRLIEEALRRSNIPYRLIGGNAFYSRKEVKDLLAYLRVVVNHNDEASLLRIINLPRRGIGPTTLLKVQEWATQHHISFWEALHQAEAFLPAKVAEAIVTFTRLIDKHTATLTQLDAYSIATQIAQRSGLLNTLHQDKSTEGVSRYEHVQELLNAIQFFVEDQAAHPREATLAHFLEEVALFTDQPNKKEETTAKVTLMTMHVAKGLEFQHVYLVGIEEGLLPSPLMTQTHQEIAEERRLFYVALTRAKDRLFISYAQMRLSAGIYRNVRPSRFLAELKTDSLRIIAPRQQQPITPSPIANNRKPLTSIPATHKHTPTLATDNKPLAIDQFKVGLLVKHPRFGKGTILAFEEGVGGSRIKINFHRAGIKQLLVKFAKLTLDQH